MNDYFNHLANVVSKRVRALAAHINDVAVEIASGLDKLPSEVLLKEGRVNHGIESGVDDAFVVLLPYVFTLTDGAKLKFKSSVKTTGASTLNVNGTGAKSMIFTDGNSTALNAIIIGQNVEVMYDGTAYQIISASTQTSAAVNAQNSAAAALVSESNSSTSAANALISENNSAASAAASSLGNAVPAVPLTGVTNLNTLADGKYKWFNEAGLVNAPINMTYALMRQESDGDRSWQIVEGGVAAGPYRIEIRRKTAGVWSNWTRIDGAARVSSANLLASQPITNQLSTFINWNSEIFDVENIINGTDITVPTGVTKIQFFFQINWFTHATGNRQLILEKNGAAVPIGGVLVTDPARTEAGQQTLQRYNTAVLPCVAGDVFKMKVFQSSGTILNLSLSTTISVELKG